MKDVSLMRMIAITIVALILGVATVNAQPRQFRDWQANCDDYANCTATLEIDADPSDYMSPDYRLSLSRDAYETYWLISLTTFATTPADNAELAVLIDDQSYHFAASSEFAAYGALNEYFLLGKTAQLLLNQLVPGTSVSFEYADENAATQRIEFSLSGLAAAMMWIDEQQSRVGSERVAEAPPTSVKKVTDRNPAPMPESLKTSAPNSTECEPLADLPNGEDGEAYRLDAEHSIYLIPCWAGAYNFSYQVYTATDDALQLQLFADYNERQGWSGTNTLVNAFYDPRSQTLSAFYKGRGIGDCGSTGLWQWDQRNFRMLEYTGKYECDGEGDPGDFPVVYRAPDYTPWPPE